MKIPFSFIGVSNFGFSELTSRRVLLKSFGSSLFQKACRSRRDRRSPSADGENPLTFKAPRKGWMSSSESLTEGSRTSGGLPLSHKVSANFIIRFFLWHYRHKEKSFAKKKADRRISFRFASTLSCAVPKYSSRNISLKRMATNTRVLDQRSLFEKSNAKTFNQTRREVSLLNLNLKYSINSQI